MSRSSGDRPASRPDWVDVLLASSLVAWAMIFGGVLAITLIVELANASFQSLPTKLFQVAAVAVFGLPLTIIVCVLIGLPALGLAKLLRLSQWWQFGMVGILAGLLVFAPLFWFTYNGLTPRYFFGLAASWFALVGGLAGIAAWREKTKSARRV